ncbi:MAG: hypothetical protein CL581_01190 [Alteromonadaceae bacterium]|uniref:hypothetical protein n=1 Tax=unclassified Marinobacter TaxID=83889 RepID=UPI000C67892C|nr:hypothetical protein [Marinobacter sp. BGYM27]MAA63383.1 hypothetical protein [Alteromonadaceae bacterium]MBH87491.1 hypothetical protein [Alteromonadaceae bacterium]MDG5499166.1 hypothetical protein [Marinobacter sp. BGYM27]|tara:strand:- start:10560 stop:10814 length:255 start_codon:yes stop_codon:yes gene_type:complete
MNADESANQPDADPREERFVVDTALLAEDQILGLVEEYCTRYHGLNDTESPFDERDKVLGAVKRGDLVVWFDPVENTAGLGQKP